MLFLRILVSRMKRLLFVALSVTALSSFLILFTQDYAGIFYPHVSVYAAGVPTHADISAGYSFPYILDLAKSDAILSSGQVWDTEILEVATGGAYVQNNEPQRAEILFYVDDTLSPATMQIESFDKTSFDTYTARGTLTLLGKTVAFESPLSVVVQDSDFFADFQIILPETLLKNVPRGDLEVLSVFLHFVKP